MQVSHILRHARLAYAGMYAQYNRCKSCLCFLSECEHACVHTARQCKSIQTRIAPLRHAGTFFNRVIDDGKESDNTRHRSHDQHGRPFLKPPPEIRRVLLCSGQIYYHLSRVRLSQAGSGKATARLSFELIVLKVLLAPVRLTACAVLPSRFHAGHRC